MNIDFKSNRVKLRKLGDKMMEEFCIRHLSENTDTVFCIERSRMHIFVICLQFCKLMFGQSNFKLLLPYNRVKTYDCGERIAGWFSMILARPCRLIRQSSDMSHQKNTKGMLSFLTIFVIPR